MKKITPLIFCLFFLLNCHPCVFAKSLIELKTNKKGARVTQLEGSALSICPGKKYATYLKTSDFIRPGCEVNTGDYSRMEIVFADKSVARFAANTRFKLIKADAADFEKRDMKIFMRLGKIWSNVRKPLGVKSGFEISSENAVAGVRGTIYAMNVEGDKSALIKVYDGEVSVSAPVPVQELKPFVTEPPKAVSGPTPVVGPKPVSMEEWAYIVKSMQQIYIKSNGQAEEPKDFTEEDDRDEWSDWNKEQDRKLII